MKLRALLAGLASLPTILFGGPLPRPPLVIQNVTVIDVVQGRQVGPRTVVIYNGRIESVEEPGGAPPAPPGAVKIDGHGLFLAPGIVDMHVHLFNNATHRAPNEWAFPLFLGSGVTGVREMATRPEQLAIIANWRTRVEGGELLAPRVLAAGVPVASEAPSEARQQVDRAHAGGADFIKVFSDVSPSSWRAILAEAGALHFPVCGHVPVQVSLREAEQRGQRSVEHLTQVYEACSTREQELLEARDHLAIRDAVKLRDEQEREVLDTFAPARCASVARELAATGQAQVPTLVLPRSDAAPQRSDFRADPRWPALREDEQQRWERILRAPAEERALAAKRWEISQRIVREMHRAKVPIFAGTDTPMPLVYPGSSLLEELGLLVACGFTPAEALRAATIEPATFLGLAEEQGTVTAGKRADLLLLEADPLVRIENLRRLRAVVLAGRLLPRSSLDHAPTE